MTPPARAGPAPPRPDAAARHAWARAACRARRLRLTHAREHILHYLAHHAAPVTWEALSLSQELSGCCDPATIARTLALFQEAELVRVIALPGKARCYLLDTPGPDRGFLVCHRCGAWSEFPLDAAILRSMETTAAACGFSWSRHDLVCHGLCRACERARRTEPAAHKLRVR
jgi:Fe2+ or Zn2+ uptake regulation protein